MELRVFNNKLYVGLLSFPRGFALLRTANLDILNVKQDDWELITGNGFAMEQREQLGARVAGNEYPWSSAEVNGVYVLGTTVSQRGISTKSAEMLGMQPQLWASRDGENWILVHHDDQPGFLFGYRTMQVTKDAKAFHWFVVQSFYSGGPRDSSCYRRYTLKRISEISLILPKVFGPSESICSQSNGGAV